MLGISQQAVSYYEKGKRIPDDKTWDKMQNILDVPVQYLKAQTNDPEGWGLWVEATGYTKEKIVSEIEQLKKVNRISDQDKLQKQIGKAVTYLDGRGGTDYNAVMSARRSIYELDNKIIHDYYIDPIKDAKSRTKNGKLSSMINSKEHYDGSLFYDDMDKEVYFKMSKIFQNALDALAKLADDIPNKK